jgi:hypothetical protein
MFFLGSGSGLENETSARSGPHLRDFAHAYISLIACGRWPVSWSDLTFASATKKPVGSVVLNFASIGSERKISDEQ